MFASALATPDSLPPPSQASVACSARGREGIVRERRRHRLRRAADGFGDGLYLVGILGVFVFSGFIRLIRLGDFLDQRGDERLVLFRPAAIDDDRVKGRRALFGDLGGRNDNLAVCLQLRQHWIPDERRVDIAALPCRRDFRRTQIDDLRIAGEIPTFLSANRS